MIALASEKVMDLSIPERIQLVEDIWDSIAEHPEQVPLTRGQKIELDKRLDSYSQNPEMGETWETVRERIKCRI